VCKRCEPFAPPAAGGGRHKRKKLREMDPRLHCSVVGTCLTLGTLRRIAVRLRLPIPADAEEYNVHGYFVLRAAEHGPTAKAMHKTLDRTYDAAIRRFGRLEDEKTLTALWDRCLEEGDVPGPYWAVVTHPAASQTLIWRVFGHVHMLSHLVGASNRADVRRLRALETERDALADALGKTKRRLSEREQDLRRLVEQHAADVRDRDFRLCIAETAAQRLQLATIRIAELESEEACQALSARLVLLARQVSEGIARAEAATTHAAALNQQVEDLRRINRGLEEALHATVSDALQTVLPSPGGEERAGTAGRFSMAMALCGQRIVYVGGRTGLIPHLRALVEQAGGVFIHHDGGIEENNERLGEVLAQGDAVLCPVDCVSHGACRRAKRLCKQRAKAFVPLRSSGLSSFISGLREIAARTGTAAIAPDISAPPGVSPR
jgi:hypothetical protein